MRAQLAVQHLHQRHHAVLRDAVRAEADVGHEPREGGGGEHVPALASARRAAARRPRRRGSRPRGRRRSPSASPRASCSVTGAGHRDAGVVEDDVGAAVVLPGGVGERLDRRAAPSRRSTTPIASAPAARSFAAAASSAFASTSASTSFAPSRASASALAKPMPLAPPVITATLPRRSFMSPPVAAQDTLGPCRRAISSESSLRSKPRVRGIWWWEGWRWSCTAIRASRQISISPSRSTAPNIEVALSALEGLGFRPRAPVALRRLRRPGAACGLGAYEGSHGVLALERGAAGDRDRPLRRGAAFPFEPAWVRRLRADLGGADRERREPDGSDRDEAARRAPTGSRGRATARGDRARARRPRSWLSARAGSSIARRSGELGSGSRTQSGSAGSRARSASRVLALEGGAQSVA